MKILMVTMSMGIGGAETHILELSRGLRARGVDVHVASAGGVFVEDLQKAGVVHHTLPLDRRKISAMLKAQKRLKTLIQKGNYDIVHAHARIPAFLCGNLHKTMRFRFVTTDHLDFALTPLLRKFTDWGEYTFAVSEDLRRYLLKNFHLNPRHISLTVNGVDTKRFSPEMNVTLPLQKDEKAVIVHISRLDAPVSICAKALMDAMLLLKKKAVLVIVGDGDHASVLREKANGINEMLGYEAVILAGAQTDVRPYLLAADIVAAPSRAAMEGMACGKPTIVSGSQGHGGIFCEALAEDAKKSNFCFRGSPLPTAETLAGEIRSLLDLSPEERQTIGAFCRRYIEMHYSVDIMVESQLRVYQKLVKHPTDGPPDVLICGYYGYGNSGDETLLSVMTENLRKRMPNIRICVLSAKPNETARYHMVDAVHRFDLLEISKKMKQGKLFLFGGGSLLQDKTSNRSLSYYLQMLHMAKKNGMKIAVFANGIGPITREKNKKRVQDALHLADSISLRDHSSLAFCREKCPKTKLRLVFDPAIQTEKSPIESIPNEAFFVVIPKKTIPDSTELLKKTILHIRKTYGLRPVMLSLFEAQDGVYARTLADEVGAEVMTFADASSCVALLSRATCLLSARLHGLVYATAASCPMFAVSDDSKLLSYMETIGMGEDHENPAVFRIGDDENTLLKRIDHWMPHRETVRIYLSEHLPAWRAMADAEFDRLMPFLTTESERKS